MALYHSYFIEFKLISQMCKILRQSDAIYVHFHNLKYLRLTSKISKPIMMDFLWFTNIS